MKTNNIEHNLKVNSLVWSLNCPCGQVYQIKKITENRIVCQEVGKQSPDGVMLHGLNLAHSNHSPENLFEVDKHVPVKRFAA